MSVCVQCIGGGEPGCACGSDDVTVVMVCVWIAGKECNTSCLW